MKGTEVAVWTEDDLQLKICHEPSPIFVTNSTNKNQLIGYLMIQAVSVSSQYRWQTLPHWMGREYRWEGRGQFHGRHSRDDDQYRSRYSNILSIYQKINSVMV